MFEKLNFPFFLGKSQGDNFLKVMLVHVAIEYLIKHITSACDSRTIFPFFMIAFRQLVMMKIF